MNCPNCKETELEKIGDNNYHCQKCDITIEIKNGKAKVEHGKGRVQAIEEDLAYTKEELRKIKEILLGNEPLLDL